MKLDFFIIGSQKAATTTIYNYLQQHPDLFLPTKAKEIHYFAQDEFYQQGISYLHPFFKEYQGEKLKGLNDVHMLPIEACPERVYNHNPDAKLIACLREPVDRAYSAYQMATRLGLEQKNVSFEEAFELEASRLNSLHHKTKYDLAYFFNGLYHKHLSKWRKWFPKNQILLITYEEFKKNPHENMNNILSFLEIHDESFEYRDFKESLNQGGSVKSLMIEKLINPPENQFTRALRRYIPNVIRWEIKPFITRNVKKWNRVPSGYAPLSDHLRSKIYPYFEDDLKKLKEEYGIDYLQG